MRRNVRIFAISLFAVIAVLSLSGITLSKLENKQDTSAESGSAKIKVVYQDKEENKAENEGEVKPGHWYKESAAVINEGKEAVFVRVELQIAQMEGENIFRLGMAENNGFVSLDSSIVSPDNKAEYWEKSGNYYYYKNQKTENKLKPGKQTSAIYEAVQLNESMSVTKLANLGEHSIIISVEYADEPWSEE
ncbi:hypothetical protein [Scatolibacter rhodanostii]|uniref:hypothetical protein n=1 Tax=Scatolibacter rhodanostii TaxID=2014781 RepID=UPI000C081C09|nr:hypothetical protein [Scatolibacter rhodanostii]